MNSVFLYGSVCRGGVEVEIFWCAEFSVYVRDSALMYVPLNDHIERMAA